MLQRRHFLKAGALASTFELSLICRQPAHGFLTSPFLSKTVEVLETRVISWKPPLYHGWPTLAKRKDGELLLAFSGGRETHLCPFGRLEWMRSKDEGKTWGWPQVLYDGPIDDRDAGVVETAKGSILVTNFTSLVYMPVLRKAELAEPGSPGAFSDPKLLLEWQAVHGRLTDEQRKQELGCYMLRSVDGGVTWSGRYRVPLNSPHGPVVLQNGRLLYAGKAIWADERVGVCESLDDGLTWDWIALIPTRPGDDANRYHELHLVEDTQKRLICHIRNENTNGRGETLQSESEDGGKTWTTPHTIGVWGLPSHLLRMKDGRLLMTYSHRRAPIGIQARSSVDNGNSWSDPMMITTDGTKTDLGYPSTVECSDGSLITVWYEVIQGSPLAQLRQAKWRIV
jgi:sialidase-1